MAGIQTKDFACSNIKFAELKKTEQLQDFDYCLITGAGILDKKIIGNKKILNIHPGIIPTTRGLDSFKWAIYNLNPLWNKSSLYRCNGRCRRSFKNI